jgi:hypothetical protein
MVSMDAGRSFRTLRALAGAAFVAGLLFSSPALAADKDMRVYEMRTYHAHPGKLDPLHARFRDHTVKLFEKHGMTNVAYWVPLENADNKLIYVLAHASREARDKAWKAFTSDPEWIKVKQATEANGPLVAKVDILFLNATDYSPEVKPSSSGARVFELRTYTASKGNLDNLNARFRNHTVKLFEKHGMTNVGYWVPMKDQKGAGDTLIYVLAHQSVNAAKASFAAFRQDPAWTAALKASEEKAGGPLTVKDGVKSVLLKATDYSPIK